MAEGEELKTNNELTIRPIRAFCDQLQLALGGQGCKLPDYARQRFREVRQLIHAKAFLRQLTTVSIHGGADR